MARRVRWMPPPPPRTTQRNECPVARREASFTAYERVAAAHGMTVHGVMHGGSGGQGDAAPHMTHALDTAFQAKRGGQVI